MQKSLGHMGRSRQGTGTDGAAGPVFFQGWWVECFGSPWLGLTGQFKPKRAGVLVRSKEGKEGDSYLRNRKGEVGGGWRVADRRDLISGCWGIHTRILHFLVTLLAVIQDMPSQERLVSVPSPSRPLSYAKWMLKQQYYGYLAKLLKVPS